MKAIKHEDPHGCSVACIASVTGITYQEALRLFPNGKEKADKTGFYCREIVSALEKKNIRYKYGYIKSRIRSKIYKDGTIVFIKRSKKYPTGHYLCRVNKTWMDPWINFPEMNKKAGFRKRLPGKSIYLISRNNL